jgi:hypothetical protein
MVRRRSISGLCTDPADREQLVGDRRHEVGAAPSGSGHFGRRVHIERHLLRGPGGEPNTLDGGPRVEPVGNELREFLGRKSLHDSPRRVLERLVFDLEDDLRDQLARQGVDVRVLVLAAISSPSRSSGSSTFGDSYRLTSATRPNRDGDYRGNLADRCVAHQARRLLIQREKYRNISYARIDADSERGEQGRDFQVCGPVCPLRRVDARPS